MFKAIAWFLIGVLFTVAAFSGKFPVKMEWGGIGERVGDDCLDLWRTDDGWSYSHVAEIVCVDRGGLLTDAKENE